MPPHIGIYPSSSVMIQLWNGLCGLILSWIVDNYEKGKN